LQQQNSKMEIPKIDFKYWLLKNHNDSLHEKRFIALITKIENLYEENTNYNQSYFCGDSIEISRLKEMNYLELENEILNKIRKITDFTNDNEILKIFDLIQIWGGLQGGSNFYNIVENSSMRLNYKNWLPKYIELIKESINKNKDAYEIVSKGKIPNLRMSFGSKHISFWSRKKNDDNCFIIIDNKIAGVSGIKNALEADYNNILSQVYNYSSEFNLKPFEIEKALFTFHKSYFDNSNTTFFGKKNDVQDKDYHSAVMIFENLIKDRSDIEKKDVKKRKKTEIISLTKPEYTKSQKGNVYISENYVNKTKILKNKLNMNYPVIIKNIKYYEYIGDINLIVILDKN
jgi:hypothetical protein